MSEKNVLGHRWVGPISGIGQGPYAYQAEWFHCKVCGIRKQMKYTMPESTLKFFGVPTCDEYIIMAVMNQ